MPSEPETLFVLGRSANRAQHRLPFVTSSPTIAAQQTPKGNSNPHPNYFYAARPASAQRKTRPPALLAFVDKYGAERFLSDPPPPLELASGQVTQSGVPMLRAIKPIQLGEQPGQSFLSVWNRLPSSICPCRAGKERPVEAQPLSLPPLGPKARNSSPAGRKTARFGPQIPGSACTRAPNPCPRYHASQHNDQLPIYHACHVAYRDRVRDHDLVGAKPCRN